MLLREKWQIASLGFQEAIKIWKQAWWSNDKTIIIELGYRKISWFVSVLQIICWSAYLWQIMMLNLIQQLLMVSWCSYMYYCYSGPQWV